jgi:hypothetical protein
MSVVRTKHQKERDDDVVSSLFIVRIFATSNSAETERMIQQVPNKNRTVHEPTRDDQGQRLCRRIKEDAQRNEEVLSVRWIVL